jgi:single-stranded-DNA-specific exonuclease
VGEKVRASFSGHAEIIEFLCAERSLERGRAALPDVGIFPDAARMKTRIERAIRDNERIVVFGDYDCDGVTGAAILARFLQRRGATFHIRLPDRAREGYGLKLHHIDEFAERGATLLLTVDNGITAHDALARAKDVGIDAIILDHHRLPSMLPPAFAILHPALAPDFSPPHPCGAGIALLATGSDDPVDIALAGIGTIADLVELRGVNRSFAAAGIEALRALRDGPLALLKELAGCNETLSGTDIAFRIAPRINAAGRMASPLIALRALLGDREALLTLETLNRKRQTETARIVEELLADISVTDPAPLVAVKSAAYPPGLLGLIAGKLTEKTGKPSIVGSLSLEGETCTASLRSVPSYDVANGLAKAAHLLDSFGGHTQAAGCTFPTQHWEPLIRSLTEDIGQTVSGDHLVPTITVDAVLDSSHVTLAFSEALSELEPFGHGNPEPHFLIENLRFDDVRRVGSNSTHLQARSGALKVIGFGLGHLLDAAQNPLDLVCRVTTDRWNGRNTPQLILEDLRVAQPAAV